MPTVNLKHHNQLKRSRRMVDITPILPDLNALAGDLSAIFQTGLNTGKQATVFAKAGDSIFTQPEHPQPLRHSGSVCPQRQ